MSGFNLPPGCLESDIPGNRPEDAQAEALWEEMEEKFPGLAKLDDSALGAVYEALFCAYQKGHDDGYQMGYDYGRMDGYDEDYADAGGTDR